MTAYINDTLGKQIERGEVYTGVVSSTIGPTAGGSIRFTIEVGANDCSFIFDVVTPVATSVNITEGLTSVAGGSTATNINLLRSSADTITTVVKTGAAIAGGSSLISYTSEDGKFPASSAINSEAGIILAANTDYSYYISNLDVVDVRYAFTWYLREIT